MTVSSDSRLSVVPGSAVPVAVADMTAIPFVKGTRNSWRSSSDNQMNFARRDGEVSGKPCRNNCAVLNIALTGFSG
jgi:hypothetical protein